MLTIYQSKPLIDKYFQDNWVQTPIQFDGVDFEAKTTTWVSVSLVPLNREVTAYDGQTGRKSEEGNLVVRCYSDSATEAYKLTDDVIQFIECKEFDGLRVGVGVPDGSGAIPLDNGVYETQIEFSIKVIT